MTLLKLYFIVLKVNPGNIKALFRRSQAFKGLQKFEDAIKDAKMLISMDPKNQEFLNYMKTLISVVENKVRNSNINEDFFLFVFSLGFGTKLSQIKS
jgi:hypothetical protein